MEKTKSEVVAKYGIPNNTISIWLKNKYIISFRKHEERKHLKTPTTEGGHFYKPGSSNV